MLETSIDLEAGDEICDNCGDSVDECVCACVQCGDGVVECCCEDGPAYPAVSDY